MKLFDLPIPIVVLAFMIGANGLYGIMGLVPVRGLSAGVLAGNLFGLIVLEIVPAVGLVLRWKIARVLILVYAAIFIVASAAAAAMEISIIYYDSWSNHSRFKLILCGVFFLVGSLLHWYFRKPEIKNVYA